MMLIKIFFILALIFFIRFCLTLYFKMKQFKRFIEMDGKKYSRIQSFYYQTPKTSSTTENQSSSVVEAEYRVLNKGQK